MRKLFVTAVLTFAISSFGFAAQADKSTQSTANANANAKAGANANAQSSNITLDSGSQISAEMTSALDLKKAKPGDSFKMKTTKPVKSQGKEIVSKGSTITGHVQQVTTVNKTTQATLVFDQLQEKKTQSTSSLSAVVTAIAKPMSATAMAQEDSMTNVTPNISSRSSTQQGSQQSGGLLGGVTQTVGGVTKGVTQTVGGVTQPVIGATGQLGSTVNSTTGATLGTAGGLIQITNDTAASAASGSTLTMANKNAKLESGTQFLLQTTSALTITRPAKQQ
ncbi:MAG TPA: hypothetical protein VN687_08625 [Blastocatellia bacterium]|nr:hypothetical protein [Blastocatellia bacterium]